MREPNRFAARCLIGAIFLVTEVSATTRPPDAQTVRAERSPALAARIVGAVPLDATGASGLALAGRWTFVVQDDNTHLAAIPPSGRVETVRVFEPIGGADRFHDAFGNKGVKPDMEAICTIRVPRAAAAALGHATRARSVEAVLAFGSGSTPESRDRVVVLFPGETLAKSRVAALRPRGLYARLRSDASFTGGGQLNVEGAAAVDGGRTVRLYNRGNGTEGSLTASVDLPAGALLAYLSRTSANPDAPFDVPFDRPTRYELGTSAGVAVSIGDAIVFPNGPGGETIVTALVAEATANANDDGPTSGTQIGLHLRDGRLLVAPVLEDGAPSSKKIEGLAVRKVSRSRGRYVLELAGVVDADSKDPAARATLLTIEVTYGGER